MRHCLDGVFLQTERLLLRQFTPEGTDLLVKVDADPRVMRYITAGSSTSGEEVEGDVLPNFPSYYPRYRGYGFWTAEEKTTGTFVGWFRDFAALRSARVKSVRQWGGRD